MRRPVLLVPFLLLSLALGSAGCKSASELYEEGVQLEIEGRHAEAVRRYAAALEKDPDQRMARGRLLEAGRVAVNEALARAEAAPPVSAADEYHRVDGLVAVAGGVDVGLPLPENYARRRRAAFDAAIAALMEEAVGRYEASRYADAVEAARRARRYEPDAVQEQALVAQAVGAYAAWAEADLAEGRYRTAYDRVDEALALGRPGAVTLARLEALQAEALERGSVRTALLPLWRTAASADDLPDGFLAALNDRIADEHGRRPPLFVVVAEPAAVRRALRDYDLERELVSTAEAADVGRALEAERVLAGEVARFGRTVEEQERETRATQTRSGERALYDRVEEDVTLTGVVAFEVVDPRAREAACEGEVERTARGRIVRGEYEGRVRTLDLDRRERRLFDPERLAEQERAVEEALLDELAEAVAVAAFDCALEAVR